jgi:hypothetical protein
VGKNGDSENGKLCCELFCFVLTFKQLHTFLFSSTKNSEYLEENKIHTGFNNWFYSNQQFSSEFS